MTGFSLFIGSSSEQKTPALALKSALDSTRGGGSVRVDSKVWIQQFKPAGLTLESIELALKNNNCGAFIFAPDDVTVKRGKKARVVRDNVLFEFGLWMGRYGRHRSWVLAPAGEKLDLPNDLASYNVIFYDRPEDLTSLSDWVQMLTGPAIEILKALQQKSPFNPANTGSPILGITSPYRSVADARHDIIKDIRKLGAPPNSEGTTIHIVGHRLREITSVMREVFDGAVNIANERPLRNVRFIVHHTDPDFLIELEPPSTLPVPGGERFRTAMARYVNHHILPNVETLRSYNDDPRHRRAGLTCETIAVRSLPNICAYMLGSQVLYLGKFLWDGGTGDFGLVRTSCFRIERGHAPADILIDWCLNIAEQQRAWSR
jgi:hypothetical protein